MINANVTHFIESFSSGVVYLDSNDGDLASTMIFVDHINECDAELVLTYNLSGSAALVPFLFNGEIKVLDSFNHITFALVTSYVDALTVNEKGSSSNQHFNYVHRQNKMIQQLLFDAGCTTKELKKLSSTHELSLDKKRLEELLQLCKAKT
jgi:hypothetical protein